MTKQVVDIGSVIANGADGDTAREAFTKVNANFTEVYDNVQSQTQAVNNKVDKVVGKSLVDDTEIAKLLTVDANATQNSEDSFLLDRANHTGTQATSTILGLDTQLSGFENKLTPGSNISIDRTDPLNPVISAPASSGLTNPMTAEGDIIIGDLDGSPVRLGVGSAGQVLTTVSGKPSWQSPSGGSGMGDVVGPLSSVDNEVVLFDGVTGKVIRGGGILGTSAFRPSTDYATSVQGAKADTAVQPEGLADYTPTSNFGSAAFTESNIYATAAQGAKADTAVQPVDLSNYATAAQGAKADTALQPSSVGSTVQAWSSNLDSWSSISSTEKQDTLVSATNIKTINGNSILGTGDLVVSSSGVFTKEYISPEQVITAGGLLTLTHMLGDVPKLLQCRLICKVAEGAYTVGSVLHISPGAQDAGSGYGVSIQSTATQLLCRVGSAGFLVLNATTGVVVSLNNANWRLVVGAYA